MHAETQKNYKDEQATIAAKAQFLREHAPTKPVLIGEFGLAPPKWGLSEYMKQDTAGVHFHNGLQASAFSGVSGTALFWWWEELDRARSMRLGKSHRVQGCQGRDRAYLWLFDPEAIWWDTAGGEVSAQ